MGIRDMLGLDWLDPPETNALRQAARQLFLLDAIDANGDLTPCGVTMARLPVEPSLSKVLLSAAASNCLLPAASMCAVATGEDPFVRAGHPSLLEAAMRTQDRLDGPEGDHITFLRLYNEWEAVAPSERERWCEVSGVRGRAMRAARDVRTQLLALLRAAGVHTENTYDGDKSAAQADASMRCREAVARGYYFNAARRMRGTSLYQTMGKRPQTVALRVHHGSSLTGLDEAERGASERLRGAEYVIFSELKWAGRAVMVRACAVEWAWIEPLLPKLTEAIDVDSILRGEGLQRGKKRHASEASGCGLTGGTVDASETSRKAIEKGWDRRNDVHSISAAQERFEARRRSRKS
jgi:ATP-dependent RNA helicase DHX8/PRP22